MTQKLIGFITFKMRQEAVSDTLLKILHDAPRNRAKSPIWVCSNLFLSENFFMHR